MLFTDDPDLSIGEKIRKFRIRAGLNQETLASQAKLSVNTVQDIETGRRAPRSHTLLKLAEALSVSPEEFETASRRGAEREGHRSDDAFSPLPGNGGGLISLNQNGIAGLLEENHLLLQWAALTTRIALMMNRREALYSMLGTVLAGLGTAGHANGASFDQDALRSIQYGLDGRQVGSEVTEWAQEQVTTLNQLAVSMSSEQLYSMAHGHLCLLQALLQSRATTGSDEQNLRLTTAHMASLAGWFAEDTNRLDRAEQHYRFAVEIADISAGKDLTIYSLSRLGATSLAKGKPALCLSQLEAARYEAGGQSPWHHFIEMFAVEAHSRLGENRQAQLSLSKADTLYDRRKTERLPIWAFWLPHPSSSAIAARSFIRNDPVFTVDLAERALARIPKQFANDRIHLELAFARGNLRLGHIGEALKSANEVLGNVKRSPMPRVEKQLIEFHDQLPEDPVADDFKERFADYARLRKARRLHS